MKYFSNIVKNIIISATFYIISISAFAWDGTNVGTISTLDVVPTGGDNYGFRVRLSGSPTMCGNTTIWAYINKSDDNYDAAVSVLLAAKMSGSEVIVYSNSDSKSYCHIGYIVLK